MSGWVAGTIKPKQDKEFEVKTSLAGTGIFQTVVVDDNRADPVVKVKDKGRGESGRKSVEQELTKVLRPDIAESFVVINANDTSDSGEGTYWEYDSKGWKQKDYKEGHEGANAQDVAGYFNDNYGYHPDPSYHV